LGFLKNSGGGFLFGGGAPPPHGALPRLESFEKTFDEKTSIIISTNSEFYKYLKSP
jgi:hypothetical protein